MDRVRLDPVRAAPGQRYQETHGVTPLQLAGQMNGIFNRRPNWNRVAQIVVVLLAALTLKHYYSNAGVNQLRWILAPTTFIVELATGTQFGFESHAGYINGERTFVIAASCAGVNFLITAFLMLTLGRWWRERNLTWKFIPIAAMVAYAATLVANTVRISTAIRLQRTRLELSWLSGNQLHRLEGIFIYFGFLLLLYLVSENLSSRTTGRAGKHAGRRSDLTHHTGSSDSENGVHPSSLLRQAIFPLLIYYATTLGIPVITAVYRAGAVAPDFWEHLLFVLLAPLTLLFPILALRLYRAHQTA